VSSKKKTDPATLATAIKAAAQAAKPAKPEETPEQRRARIRDLSKIRALETAVDGERGIRSYLTELARETAMQFDVPPPYKPPKPAPKSASGETMVQHLSDWHTYEDVQAARTRGINEYNGHIAGQRARRVVDTHLSIKERMERGGGWHFEELVLPLNGDFVPGTIHELERHTDAPNVVMAVYGTALLVAQTIRALAAAYPRTRVYCTSGNHGRLPDARKVQTKEPTRSWDTVVYLLAREHLRGMRNITWNIPDSWGVRYDIYKWGFLQMHGHFVKSWMNLPYYGLDRMTRNTTSLEAVRGWTPNYFLCGHFHTGTQIAAPAGELLVNGSLVGANEFVIDGMGKAEPPMQHMFGVHPEHGITHTWKIQADAPKDAPAFETTPWLELQNA
jgi:hypothetical protein